MTFETAIQGWNNACFDILGVDGNGDEINRITTFGAFVLGANGPTSLSSYSNSHSEEQLRKVSILLHAWAEVFDKRVLEIMEGNRSYK